MAITWVNAKDIMDTHNKVNKKHQLTHRKALEIKKRCKDLYEKEHGKVEMWNDDLIPLDWYETYFGNGLLIKNKKKKDTSTSTKQ